MNVDKFKSIYHESRNGANQFYRHWCVRNLIYSDGVRDLVEEGCAWLLDKLATECVEPFRRSGAGEALIEVRVGGDASADLRLTVADDAPPLWQSDVYWTDMPEGEWVFVMGHGDTDITVLCLLSER